MANGTTDDPHSGSETGSIDVDATLEEVYRHLVATEELPVEREAGHWLGEAQAVVGDLRSREADEVTLRRRLETVGELLQEFDATGHETADDHVAAARELVDDLRATVDDGSKH